MGNDRLLNVQEMAFTINVSVQTIGSWYKWKALHADSELAKMLPDYVRIGNKNTRYWKSEDAWKLLEFKKSIPQGRSGVMGDVTQKYAKKKNED